MTANISVIIAAYNVERYIERAIRSALDQQNVSVEVIVANDKSTDRTADIVHNIQDSRIKLIDMPANGGPGRARNAAIHAASAPWIAILDGDDAFVPTRLLTLLDRATTTNADIVIDNLMAQHEEDGASYPFFDPNFFDRFETLDLATFIARNTDFQKGDTALGYVKPLIKRAFLTQHHLQYSSLPIGEDYLLMAEALACGAKCAVEKSAGYFYTIRTGSISYRLSLENLERMMEADKKLVAKYTFDPVATHAQKKRDRALIEMYTFTQLVDALKSHNYTTALKAFLTNPLAACHLSEAIWNRLSGKKYRA